MTRPHTPSFRILLPARRVELGPVSHFFSLRRIVCHANGPFLVGLLCISSGRSLNRVCITCGYGDDDRAIKSGPVCHSCRHRSPFHVRRSCISTCHSRPGSPTPPGTAGYYPCSPGDTCMIRLCACIPRNGGAGLAYRSEGISPAAADNASTTIAAIYCGTKRSILLPLHCQQSCTVVLRRIQPNAIGRPQVQTLF